MIKSEQFSNSKSSASVCFLSFSFCLTFCQFQPSVAYIKVMLIKKRAYEQVLMICALSV